VKLIGFCIVLALFGTSLPLAAQAVVTHYELNIPRQSLDAALNEFARQTGLQIARFSSVTASAGEAGPVSGSFTSQEALKSLLEGSGLSYRVLNDRTIAIVVSSEPTGSLTSVEGASSKSDEGVPHAALAAKEDKKSSSGFRLAQVDTGKTADAAAVAKSDDNTSQRAPAQIEEVVVTAQKRVEKQQDVPSSIAVLSGEKLTAEGVVQLSDYSKQIPGLNVIGAAGPAQGEVVIRGIFAGSTGSAVGSAVVGMYLDDVSFTPSSPLGETEGISLDPDLADIERIEVLEGPQSTLYGASVMGGLIKIVTKQPVLNDFEGSVRVDGTQIDGGGSGYGVRAAVNIPIIQDAVALRVTAFDRQDPGFIDNASTGQKNINEDTVKGGRASLLIKANDMLETTVSGFWQDINQRGPNQVFLNPVTKTPSLGALAYSSPIGQGDVIQNRALSDTTTLDMRFGKLTNIASYASLYASNFQDYSAYGGFVNAPPGVLVSIDFEPSTTRYSDELRLAASHGPFEGLLGGFYTNERNADTVNLRGTDSSGVTLPVASPYYNVYSFLDVARFTEYAAFGDFTYHVTDQLEGTFGARYSYDKQSYQVSRSGLLGSGPLQGEATDSATTYLATVSYKPESTLTLYLRAASAYRPGGTQALAPSAVAAGVSPNFGPDTLWNYEAGAKGSFWGGRGAFTAAIYHMKWFDVQLNTRIQGFDVLANAAGAMNNGAEASMQLLPLEGLSMSFNVAYNDAKITSNVPTIGAVSGDPLPYSQKFSAATLVDYIRPLANTLSGTAGLTYAYHDGVNTGFQDGVSYRLPAYDTLDLRAGVKWSRYALTLRAENVFNKFALSNAAPLYALNSPFAGQVIIPRTYRASFEARF